MTREGEGKIRGFCATCLAVRRVFSLSSQLVGAILSMLAFLVLHSLRVSVMADSSRNFQRVTSFIE